MPPLAQPVTPGVVRDQPCGQFRGDKVSRRRVTGKQIEDRIAAGLACHIYRPAQNLRLTAIVERRFEVKPSSAAQGRDSPPGQAEFRESMQHEPRMEVSWCDDVARV